MHYFPENDIVVLLNQIFAFRQNGEDQPDEEDFLYFCASCNNVYETKHEFRQHKPNCKKGLDLMQVEETTEDGVTKDKLVSEIALQQR